MSDAVIVGLIAAAGSVLCQIVISRTKSRETDAKMIAHEQKQEDGLEEVKRELSGVKRRLDEHNGYAKMFNENSKHLAVLNTKQDNLDRAIGQLQKDIDCLKSDRCKV